MNKYFIFAALFFMLNTQAQVKKKTGIFQLSNRYAQYCFAAG